MVFAWLHYSGAVKLRCPRRSQRGRRAAVGFVGVFAGVGLMFAAALRAAERDGGNPIAAVWKEQHLNFFYMGRTSRYSCDGLRDKVRAMLLDLGARRDIRVTALRCADAAGGARPDFPGPSLNIVVSTPALPDTSAKPLRP